MGPAGRIIDRLVQDVEALRFGVPVTHVYNPLVYARAAHDAYVRRYGRGRREVLLLGMNPGPWGMAQTGVPFGDVGLVREFLGIEAPVERPTREHPKRPVMGFLCPRGEVSGARLWGWVRATWGCPADFFARFQVVNYCPLCFMEASGRNRTPDRLPEAERRPLFAACDRALQELVRYHRVRLVVGLGRFAEERARAALTVASPQVEVGRILHPSPASPLANRGWGEQATRQLSELGVRVP